MISLAVLTLLAVFGTQCLAQEVRFQGTVTSIQENVQAPPEGMPATMYGISADQGDYYGYINVYAIYTFCGAYVDPSIYVGDRVEVYARWVIGLCLGCTPNAIVDCSPYYIRKISGPPPPQDSDGDGIPDSQDQCPYEYGPPPTGCPQPPQEPYCEISSFYVPDSARVGEVVNITGEIHNTGNGAGNCDYSLRADGTYVTTGSVYLYSFASSTVRASHSFSSPGSFRVEFCTQDECMSAMINVTAEKRPPMVSVFASPTSGNAPLTVNFSCESHDPDGYITSYYWTFGDGGTSSSPNPSHTYNNAGTYTATLTVTDNDGLQASDSITIRVESAPNRPPTIVLDFPEGGEVLTGTVGIHYHGRDEDRDMLEVRIELSDNGGSSWRTIKTSTHTTFPDFNEPNLPWDTTAFPDGDNYRMKAVANDGKGGSAYDMSGIFSIRNRRNQPPDADFTWSPGTPREREEVSFTDRSRDPDGYITSWRWTFGDGSSSTSQNPRHTYSGTGNYEACLTVTDNQGTSDTACKTISVGRQNQPPVADFSWTPSNPKISESVQFQDKSNDPDGTIASWSWNFGDGGSSSQRNPSHAYSSSGTYNVCLTVTDNQGATGRACKNLSVQAEAVTIKFTGKAVRYEQGTRPGAASYWAVDVDQVISGPRPCSYSLPVITYQATSDVWGYVDPNISAGDKVEVFGKYEAGVECAVRLEGSTSYYIKRVEQPKKTRLYLYAQDEKTLTALSVMIEVAPLPNKASGWVTTHWEGDYTQGTSVTLTAPASITLDDKNYSFIKWSTHNHAQRDFSEGTITVTLDTEVFDATAWYKPTAEEKKPDLIIEDIWNEGTKIYYKIKNIGEAAAETTCISCFYSTLYVDGKEISRDWPPNLAPGQSATQYFTDEWVCSDPSDLIRVVADAGNHFAESDEGNNEREETLDCPTQPTPEILDFGITKEEANVPTPGPLEADKGQRIRLWYQIKNPGSQNIEVGLGASIRDQSGNVIDNQANDRIVTAQPGTYWASRYFDIPQDAEPGEYDVAYGLWDKTFSKQYQATWKEQWLGIKGGQLEEILVSGGLAEYEPLQVFYRAGHIQVQVRGSSGESHSYYLCRWQDSNHDLTVGNDEWFQQGTDPFAKTEKADFLATAPEDVPVGLYSLMVAKDCGTGDSQNMNHCRCFIAVRSNPFYFIFNPNNSNLSDKDLKNYWESELTGYRKWRIWPHLPDEPTHTSHHSKAVMHLVSASVQKGSVDQQEALSDLISWQIALRLGYNKGKLPPPSDVMQYIDFIMEHYNNGQKQEADCDGYSVLFVSLARAIGIPSRMVYSVGLDNTGKETGHAWVEVNYDGKWRIWDPTNYPNYPSEVHNSTDYSGYVSNLKSIAGFQRLFWVADELGVSRSSDYGLKQKSISAIVQSPVTLHAYDSQGRHVGVSNRGEVDLQIPEAYYSGPDSDPQVIFIWGQSENIIFEVKALSEGSFNLTINQSSDGELTTLTYSNVLVTAQSQARVEISPSNPDYDLSLDLNGDGKIDSTVRAEREESRKGIDEVVAQHSGNPTLIEDADILWAIDLWISGAEVPGTGGKTISDNEMLELIQLWISQQPVSSARTSGQATEQIRGALAVERALVYPSPMDGRGSARFVAQGPGIRDIKVQVFSLAGQEVFDSGFVGGRELSWDLTNAQGKPLANGVYLYVITARGFDGQVIRSGVRKLVILR
jgi:PKD repeat protein